MFYHIYSKICHLEIDSWTMPLQFLHMRGNLSTVKTTSWRDNGEWDLVDAWIHEEMSYGVGMNFVTLSLVMHLRRKPLYYVLNLFLPMVGLSMLQLTMFRLHSDSGEKVGLGLTLLLSQTVLQLVVQEKIPESSDNTPIVGKRTPNYYLGLC